MSLGSGHALLLFESQRATEKVKKKKKNEKIKQRETERSRSGILFLPSHFGSPFPQSGNHNFISLDHCFHGVQVDFTFSHSWLKSSRFRIGLINSTSNLRYLHFMLTQFICMIYVFTCITVHSLFVYLFSPISRMQIY